MHRVMHTYRSKTTQNNISDISAKFVTDNVVNEVEGSDVSVKEQLSLVILQKINYHTIHRKCTSSHVR